MFGVEPVDVVTGHERAHDSSTSGRRGTFGDKIANAAEFENRKRVGLHFARVPRVHRVNRAPISFAPVAPVAPVALLTQGAT